MVGTTTPVMLTWLPRLASPSYSLLPRAPRTASSWRASKVPALQISGTKWLIVILTSPRGPPARERAVRSSDLTHQPVQPAFPARLVDLRRRHLPNVFTGQLRFRRGPPPPRAEERRVGGGGRARRTRGRREAGWARQLGMRD